MAHIAFKGAAPLKLDLLSGRIQIGGDQLSTSLAEIRAGQLKALATNGVEAHPRAAGRAHRARAGLRRRSNSRAGTGCSRRRKRRGPSSSKLQRETVAAVRHPDSAEALQRPRRRAGRLLAGRAGRDPAPPDRAVPAGDPGIKLDSARIALGSGVAERTSILPMCWTASAPRRPQISARAASRSARSSPAARTLISSCAVKARSTSAITASLSPFRRGE